VVDVPLGQGNSNVTVLYREFTQMAYVTVNWQLIKGGPAPTPVPPAPPAGQCSPPSASSVQTRFGDYTPCIQQNIHQVNCFQSDGAWNSPNQGSIEMEPQITIWGNCPPDTVASFQVSCDPNVPHAGLRLLPNRGRLVPAVDPMGGACPATPRFVKYSASASSGSGR
jgi:hypothetical protein